MKISSSSAIVLAAIILITNAPPAFAGFLDKLNAATQKLNEKTQQLQNRSAGGQKTEEDPDRPLHLDDHYKGSCYGKHSATCMDYMEVAGQCMAPLKGYRAKLLADRIEHKLKKEKLTDQQRKNLEEDLAGLREAEKNKVDEPTIAGEKNSQRYLQDISEEDQVYVNAEYNKFYQKIYNKCMGADHMNIGRRTEMNTGETISGDQSVAEFKRKKEKDDSPMNCIAKVSGVRNTIMAEMLEKKMQGLKLSDKERAEWEADIASLKEAGEAGEAMPKAADRANPYRGMMRLTSPEEQMALGQEASTRTEQELKKCTDMAGSGKIKEREIKSGGLVDKSKSPANKKAQKQEKNTKFNNVNGGALGAGNLTYMKGYVGCFAPLKGHFAKVHADMLEKRLKEAKGISEQKRTEWEEDIAAWRAAQQAGVDQPDPPDPENPYRWYDYVSNKDRQKINKQHADFNNKIIKECGDKPAGL